MALPPLRRRVILIRVLASVTELSVPPGTVTSNPAGISLAAGWPLPGALLSTQLVLSQYLRWQGGPVTGGAPRYGHHASLAFLAVRVPLLWGLLSCPPTGDVSCVVSSIQQGPQETQQ